MNFYERQTEPVPTPAIVTRAGEDFYLSLTAFTEEGQTASFNAWIFPLVAWIWWSIPTLVIGALIAMWPQRRRAATMAMADSPAPATAGNVNPGPA
ncbi:MAG TPA: hypothetical protein VH208_03255 [Myxococcaceae bacterium]|nr:hypothetical protein [Myxococcaceae bacterium]